MYSAVDCKPFFKCYCALIPLCKKLFGVFPDRLCTFTFSAELYLANFGSRITGNITETAMESLSEVSHDSLDSTKSDLQICQQTMPLLTPSTPTEETNSIMPLKSETIGEQNEVVEKEGLNLPSSTGKAELVYKLQSINETVQSLLSALKEYNVRILENKIGHETLLNNLNLPGISSKDFVDTFKSLIASKNKIVVENLNENGRLLVIKEAVNKISGMCKNPSFVDNDLIGAFEKLNAFLESIHDEHNAHTSLLVEIEELSYTISNKLHVNYCDS